MGGGVGVALYAFCMAAVAVSIIVQQRLVHCCDAMCCVDISDSGAV